jgi:N-acetylmuramoyl-L-alanine amidase
MLRKTLIILLCCMFPMSAMAAKVKVTDVRVSNLDQRSRIVFELNGPVNHKIFTLTSPNRIVLDIDEGQIKRSVLSNKLSVGPINKIRAGAHEGKLRLVLDVKEPLQAASFLLKPEQGSNYRLVVDLKGKHSNTRKVVKKSIAKEPKKLREVVIAIDAGHGGKDPGASGRKGTKEKHVVLALAKKLAAYVDKEPGMKAVLVRKDDRYIKLRKRTEIARKHNADLLVSIHADAFRNAYAKGSSVFVLSEGGATSEAAKWLADHENAADLVGGISLDDKDDMLRSVLLDLSQSASIEASLDVGGSVLKQLKRLGKVHKQNVEQAGFAVLKSPDIPSILIETGFISNPQEEKRLRDSRHQDKMARSLFKGIRGYFHANPPPGTWLAMNDKKHVIARGETLSEIASKYRVGVKQLRAANALSSDRIRVGQVLHIPLGADG